MQGEEVKEDEAQPKEGYINHRDQIIAMLEDADIDFGSSGGDSIIDGHCRFRFYSNGRLKDIASEGGDDDE